jgi:hypothetical protein
MSRLLMRWIGWTGALVLGSTLLVPARAQDADDQQRGVARISVMDGEVSVRRGDSGDWVAGVINAPLMADDRISTGPNSRAEVQFDAANILRLGGTAEVRLATLEYGRFQIELAHGMATYRILRPTNANVEVDTPNISVRPSKVGAYRISVTDSGETQLVVRSGDVEVYTPRGSQWVNAGQMMVARGTTSDPEFQIVGAPPYDDWDRWCDSRDQMLTRSVSDQYVPQGVYGAEDLDNYGSWVNTPDYGYCWQPTVAADWAPYGSGRWVWEDWYGWSWVSYDPWGWAPYHYGRWFWRTHYGWMWYPGVMGVRHYWSPALVAFFGFGGGGGFGFGFGNVGWVPLAPYEVFHPWWGRGFYGRRDFDHNIHFTNVNITNVYRNARIQRGITAVGVSDFREGRFGRVMRPSMDQVRNAGVVRGAMPMSPTNANLRFSDRQVNYVPRSNGNTRFFQHQQPSVAQRVPFAQVRGGEPNGSAMQGSRNDSVNRGNAGGSASGWRRFGEPGGQSGNRVAPSVAPRNEGPNGGRFNQSPSMQNTRPDGAAGGWRRFGEPGAGRNAPAVNNGGGNAPRYNAPNIQRQESPRYNAPSTQRYEAPRYNAPSVQRQEAPRYNAPNMNRQEAPRYEAPRYNAPSAPRYEAPRTQAPRNFGGGGGGRPSGGGGHPAGGGGGGGGGSHGGGHGRR